MAALAAIGPILSGVIGFAQAQYQAQVAEMNQEVAQDNAGRAIQRSQVNEQDNDAQSLAMFGEQDAAMAASGLSINSDTNRRIRRSSRILGRRDTLNIRQDAEIEKYNHLVQAENFKAEAGSAKLGGFGTLLGGFIQGGGSLLGSGTYGTGYAGAPKPYMKPRVLA